MARLFVATSQDPVKLMAIMTDTTQPAEYRASAWLRYEVIAWYHAYSQRDLPLAAMDNKMHLMVCEYIEELHQNPTSKGLKP